MNPRDFMNQLKRQCAELDEFRHRKLPILVGSMAKDHFQDNFRQGGFTNRGLHQWDESKRQKSGSKKASANYGPLLSRRNHLFNSVKYIPGDSRVTVTNTVPYAAIHNNGGTVSPTVTPKMRGFAWARYYETAGISKKMKAGGKARRQREENASEDALRWKRMALTKKKKLSIRIPKRQFIGQSEELENKIEQMIETNISNILNK